ncbi:MAG: hypothetical protein NVS4B3_11050 [Gemmatimonadaceae bacterium]
MTVPVDPEKDKAQEIAEERRHDTAECIQIHPRRRTELEDHDRDKDRDDTVAECFDALFVHGWQPVGSASGAFVSPIVIYTTRH